MATGGKSMNICLVGLPKSGRTNIISSLLGYAALYEKTNVVIYENLLSDDGIKYNIYDLPSIGNIESDLSVYNEPICSVVKKCDLVMWVSDSTTAFSTSNELTQFNKIRLFLDENKLSCKLAIVISKANTVPAHKLCSAHHPDTKDNLTNLEFLENELGCDCGEIEDGESFESLKTCINALNLGTPIIYFNAFGRNVHSPRNKMSNGFYKNSSGILCVYSLKFKPFNTNTEFNLKQFIDDKLLISPEEFEFNKIKEFVNVQFTDFIKITCDRCIFYKDDEFNKIGQVFSELFNSCEYEENKDKLLHFILYYHNGHILNEKTNLLGLTDNDAIDIDKLVHNNSVHRVWNLLCKFIKINIGNALFNKYVDKLNHYQTYRLIVIANDVDIYNKLRVYANCRLTGRLDLFSGTNENTTFIFEPIYNIEYFTSGKMFELFTTSDHNCKYTVEIFSTSTIQLIKSIRAQVFGNAENDITEASIVAAYEKYGLFWKPLTIAKTV